MTTPKPAKRIKPDHRCETCGHEKMVHKTLSKGQNSGACAISGCHCHKFIPAMPARVIRRGLPPVKSIGEQLRFYPVEER